MGCIKVSRNLRAMSNLEFSFEGLIGILPTTAGSMIKGILLFGVEGLGFSIEGGVLADGLILGVLGVLGLLGSPL